MRSPHVLPASNVAFWQSSQLLIIPAWYLPTEIPCTQWGIWDMGMGYMYTVGDMGYGVPSKFYV